MAGLDPGNGPTPPTRRQALMLTRLIWGVLVLSEVVTALVLPVFLLGPERPVADHSTAWVVFLIGLGLVAVLIPVGLFARGQVFKRHWRGMVVTPRGYVMGNILALGATQATVMFSLVGAVVAGTAWPSVLPGGLGFLVQLALWPNGRAMEASGEQGR